MASRRLFDGAQAGLGPLPVVAPAGGGILAGAESVGGSAQADGRGTAVRPAAGGAAGRATAAVAGRQSLRVVTSEVATMWFLRAGLARGG